MISRLRYVFREMWASLARNKTLTVAAVITAAVSLFLSGMGLLFQRGFDNQLSKWTGGVEVLVYVKHDTPQSGIEFLHKNLLAQTTLVESVDYCDEACDSEVAKKIYASDPGSLKNLLPVIPSFFRVRPVDKSNPDVLKTMKDSFATWPNVVNVESPDAAVTLLSKLRGTVGPWVFGLSIILLAVSILLIWNTIRTAMFARRREIEVMKLVGATNWFIRLPFMLEGLLQGLVGSFVGGVLLLVVNQSWTSTVRGFPRDSGLSGLVVVDGYPYWVAAGMMLLGAVVGAVGSGIAASRFLDV
jgi:cell division transport system permease protein